MFYCFKLGCLAFLFALLVRVFAAYTPSSIKKCEPFQICHDFHCGLTANQSQRSAGGPISCIVPEPRCLCTELTRMHASCPCRSSTASFGCARKCITKRAEVGCALKLCRFTCAFCVLSVQVSNGILRPCPHVHIKDYLGSPAFMQATLEKVSE